MAILSKKVSAGLSAIVELHVHVCAFCTLSSMYAMLAYDVPILSMHPWALQKIPFLWEYTFSNTLKSYKFLLV